MTIEYVLLLVVTFAIGMKIFVSAPMDAFKNSAPKLGARVEKQLNTGAGFPNEWEKQ
jgi:hypothetical protein